VNTFGSVKRMAMAFEVEALEEVAARIRGFLDTKSPQGLFEQNQRCCQSWQSWDRFPEERKGWPIVRK